MSPSQPIPVLFFTACFGGGGAEMHLLRVINHLDRTRIRPMLALARPGGSYERMLRDDVSVFHLNPPNIKGSTRSLLKAVRPLARLIDDEAPRLLVPVLEMPSAMAWLAMRHTKKSRPKLVCMQQNNFSAFLKDDLRRRLLFQGRICNAYRNADHIISLSEGVAGDIVDRIPTAKDRVSVIYNAAWDDELVSMSHQHGVLDDNRKDRPVIVACGRLTTQKGFPVLIDAFSRVRSKFDAALWILGQGPDEVGLKHLVKSYGLEADVRFLGFCDNPFAYFRYADLFVLSSLWEGFGNVIVEAMACGTAVISTDCPFGPNEILDGGRYGRLVPTGDAKSLASEIYSLLADDVSRQSLASEGQKRAKEFHSELIAAQYSNLLESISEND